MGTNTKQTRMARELAAQNPGMKHTQALRQIREQAASAVSTVPVLERDWVGPGLAQVQHAWDEDPTGGALRLWALVDEHVPVDDNEDPVWPMAPNMVLRGVTLALLTAGAGLDPVSVRGALAALVQRPMALIPLLDSNAVEADKPVADLARKLSNAVQAFAAAEPMVHSVVELAGRQLVGEPVPAPEPSWSTWLRERETSGRIAASGRAWVPVGADLVPEDIWTAVLEAVGDEAAQRYFAGRNLRGYLEGTLEYLTQLTGPRAFAAAATVWASAVREGSATGQRLASMTPAGALSTAAARAINDALRLNPDGAFLDVDTPGPGVLVVEDLAVDWWSLGIEVSAPYAGAPQPQALPVAVQALRVAGAGVSLRGVLVGTAAGTLALEAEALVVHGAPDAETLAVVTELVGTLEPESQGGALVRHWA